jgi:hypothetical protein
LGAVGLFVSRCPLLGTAADLSKALGAVLTAISRGEIAPEEAVSVAQLIEVKRKSFETLEIEERLASIEARMAKRR